MKYIGVKGHRGSGKNSISYLLGRTINYIYKHGIDSLDHEYFDTQYKKWCDELMENESCINNANLEYVYFDSFSDSIKGFIRMMLGCPSEFIYEDKYKDLIVVNLKDLSYRHIYEFEKIPELKTSAEIYNDMPFNSTESPITLTKDRYMLLREFIMYFGYDVMQRFFGKNIWVKILRASCKNWDDIYDRYGDNYKIFTDLKTQAEMDFIKQNNGVVINTIRPSNKKGKSKLTIIDDKSDYNILINGDLMSIKEEIVQIAKNIKKN